MNLDKKRLAREIIRRLDMHNLFPPNPLAEEWEEAATGSQEAYPQRTLRYRNYDSMPLKIVPKYTGDFLEKLKEKIPLIKEGADPTNLLDFSMPSEMLKHQEEPHPRHIQDYWYEFSRPGDGAGMETLKHYYDRGWDSWDAPEMSEDKRERMYTFPKRYRVRRVLKSFLKTKPDPRVVVARHLLEYGPVLDLSNRRVAKTLSDLEDSLIYTKKNGWRKPGTYKTKVSVRMIRAEPRVGRWTFATSSGGDVYTTVFQFIPKGNTRDTNKLHVRVSCTCPSFLWWGAQFNAFMGDYLYLGRIRPKLTRPMKRDPTGKFLVCKHILACIPTVSRYNIGTVPSLTREKLKRAPKVTVEKMPEEDIRVPADLKPYGEQPDIAEVEKKWDMLSSAKRKNFIMGLEDPKAVAYMAHRFPNTATPYVAKKLKDIALHDKDAEDRQEANKELRGILGG